MQQLSPRDALNGLAPVHLLRPNPWTNPVPTGGERRSSSLRPYPYGLCGTGQQIALSALPLFGGFGQYTAAVQAGTQAGTAVAAGGVKQLVISAPTITGGILTGVATTGGIWGMTAAVAIPVIGAAVAGITIALMVIFSRKGPKQKVATTQIVDVVEPHLKDNVAAYLSGPRTRSSQAQAIENFKAGWQYVVEHCGIPEMGEPGQRCISDRSRGGQWDWFSYYYDPIADDPNVQPDPTVIEEAGATLSSVVSSIFGTTATAGGGTVWLALGAVALLLVLAFSMGGGK